MFSMGTPELLVILAIALIVIGPRKLPDLAKSLGKGFAEFKKAAEELRNQVDMEGLIDEDEEEGPVETGSPSRDLDAFYDETKPEESTPEEGSQRSDDLSGYTEADSGSTEGTEKGSSVNGHEDQKAVSQKTES